jgi:hypothetical protein
VLVEEGRAVVFRDTVQIRICRTLGWQGFPASPKEFDGYLSFRTHGLGVLLHLSGSEEIILEKYVYEWSVVVRWNSSLRYRAIETTTEYEVVTMIRAAKVLVSVL